MNFLRPFREFRAFLTLAGPVFEGKRAPMAKAVGWSLAGTLVVLARPWPMKFVIDAVTAPRAEGAIDVPIPVVAAACAATFGLALVSGLCATEEAKSTADVAKSITTRIRKRVFSHLHGLPLSFHTSHGSGDLLVRLMGDVSNVRDLIFESWMGMGTAVVSFVGGVIAMALINPWLALVAVLPLPLLLLSMRSTSVRLTAVTRRARRKEGVAASFAGESLRQVVTIKAFGASDDVTRAFGRDARSSERAAGMATELAARIERNGEILAGLGLAALIGLGVYLLQRGAVTAGDLVVLVSYARTLGKPIRGLSKQGARTSKALACATRLRQLLEVPKEDPGPETVAPSHPGSIEFRDVRVVYPNGTRALDGLSCTFPEGKLIAVTGPNGAGKSTTLNVLLRLVAPTEGGVTCADGPIDGYSLRSWRDRIAFVPQSLQLFGGTLRDNLRIADKEATDERIREAFVRAGADDLFDVLPAGLDTVIGEGGSTLSGGQARRVMLARAALRSAPILLLDEPFAGLDPESRKSVAAAIRNVGKGRTIIIVTHEALDLVRPDVVLRIEHGRLAEGGIA